MSDPERRRHPPDRASEFPAAESSRSSLLSGRNDSCFITWVRDANCVVWNGLRSQVCLALFAASWLLVISIGLLNWAGLWRAGLTVPELASLNVVWGLGVILISAWQWGPRVALPLLVLVLAGDQLLKLASGDGLQVLEFAGTTSGMLLLLVWILNLRREQQRLNELASCDALTRIANRRGLKTALIAEFCRLERTRRPCSVVMLDCDKFKPLNDQFGHARGDDALVLIADTLRKNVRTYDTVARWGGDEFVILLAEADTSIAEHVLERLLTQLRFALLADFPQLSLAAGVVTFHACPEQLDAGLAVVDEAMYRAKQRGPGRVEFETWPPTTTPVPPLSVVH